MERYVWSFSDSLSWVKVVLGVLFDFQLVLEGVLLFICIKMEEIVASVADLKFEIEAQLYNQVGVQPLPFPGMDSTILDCLLNLKV